MSKPTEIRFSKEDQLYHQLVTAALPESMRLDDGSLHRSAAVGQLRIAEEAVSQATVTMAAMGYYRYRDRSWHSEPEEDQRMAVWQFDHEQQTEVKMGQSEQFKHPTAYLETLKAMEAEQKE